MLHVDTSAPRGRTLDGGTIWSLGIKVPRGDSSGEGRAAHGPLHPAVDRSLETWMAHLFVFCYGLGLCSLVDCFAFLSLGLVVCLVFEPFKPRPVFGFFVWVPPSFCVWLVSSTPCFLFLFLSGAGETQTPFGGFGVPLVFSSCRTRSPSTTRTSRSAPSPRPRPAPAFFFFPFVVVARFWSVFARPCSVGVGCFGGCLFCLWSLFFSVRSTAR